MGIINFTWKKLVVAVAIVLGIISSVITIADAWGRVTSGLITFFIWIGKAIISPIGRDIILFLLIGYVLYVIFKRRKGLAKVDDTGKKIEVREEAIFILETLGAIDNCETFKDAVFYAYKEKFGSRFKDTNETTLNFNAIINWLKRQEYISDTLVEDSDGFEENISIEDAGFAYLDKVKKKLTEEKKSR